MLIFFFFFCNNRLYLILYSLFQMFAKTISLCSLTVHFIDLSIADSCVASNICELSLEYLLNFGFLFSEQIDKSVINTRNQYHFGHCNDLSSNNQMKDIFMKRFISSEFSYFCRNYGKECSQDNVSVIC